MAGDLELRRRTRDQAYTYVAQKRRLADNIGERLASYRSLLGGTTKGATIAPSVMAQASADGRYFQLRPQEPEHTVLSAVKEPASAANAQRLARLVENQPDYLAALQELGRILNDLRDYRNALVYLQRALPLNRQSARTLCELGRAQFGLNQRDEACRTLESAVTMNPHYTVAWQYLLRLLAVNKTAEGRRWAEKVHEIHPRNFTLALAGARLYPAADGVSVLHRLLDFYAPSFTKDEKPVAAAAFSQAILDIAGPELVTTAALELLRRACDVFPESARLADLLRYALHLAGSYEESNRHYVRALDLRRTSAVYRAEYPKEDGRIHFWQFAENIRQSQTQSL
jgi:tetratricopeptide (TPR) repeat protein